MWGKTSCILSLVLVAVVAVDFFAVAVVDEENIVVVC